MSFGSICGNTILCRGGLKDYSIDFLGIYTFSVAISFVFEISARSLVFALCCSGLVASY